MHRAIHAARREVAIVADVQGPKIRIGEIAGGTTHLVAGDLWTLDRTGAPGNARRVPVSIPGFSTAARKGDPVLLGDGNVGLIVERVSSHEIVTRVTQGGSVGSHAGLFLPRAHLRTSILGPQDRASLRVSVHEGVDFVALSFVRNAADIDAGRRFLDRLPGGSDVRIIAKIERAEALENIDGILDRSDGIMVARGDLGIEVPLERLALEQKSLVRRANHAGRFVIVATQMLLSMLHASRPSRAEATDVANAVLDGADAVMLSEESAVGEYPFDAVQWLARIAGATEEALVVSGSVETETPNPASDRSVASAAVRMAVANDAAAIVTPTHSGRTAGLVASFRPPMPVIALSAHESTRRRLALVWGVEARASPAHQTLLELRRDAGRIAAVLSKGKSRPVVLTAGYPLDGRPTNLVTLVAPARR